MGIGPLVTTRFRSGSGGAFAEDGLDLNVEGDLVAEHHGVVSAGNRSVVADTEVLTVDLGGGAEATPSNRSKRPRTSLTTMWRTTKDTSEWIGSMSHVPGRLTRPPAGCSAQPASARNTTLQRVSSMQPAMGPPPLETTATSGGPAT
jgi:hypothetical protein